MAAIMVIMIRRPAEVPSALAAEAGDAPAFLSRAPEVAAQPSPAALRLAVRPAAGGWQIEVLKRRGGWRPESVHLAAAAG